MLFIRAGQHVHWAATAEGEDGERPQYVRTLLSRDPAQRLRILRKRMDLPFGVWGIYPADRFPNSPDLCDTFSNEVDDDFGRTRDYLQQRCGS